VRKFNQVICRNEDTDSQVGIEIDNESILVTFPKVYGLDFRNDAQRNKNIKLLIYILEKYKRKANQNNVYIHQDNLLDNLGEKFQFSTCLWVLNDYLKNGYYIERESYYSRNISGNIDFKKTIKKNNSFLSNSNIVYLEFIVKKNRTTMQNPVSIIHKYVVEQSFYFAGWLYPNSNFEKNIILPFSLKSAVKILNNEIQRSFIDYKKNLLKHLRDFLTGSAGENSKDEKKFLKVKKFEHVWEEMLRELIGNEETKAYNSKTFWWNEQAELIKPNKDAMPDIIYKAEDLLLVLDAKYYPFFKDRNGLPSTVDINKQIAYSSAIKNNWNINRVIDAFLLPNVNESNLITYFGYATSEFMKDKKVHGIFIDIYSVMKIYLGSINSFDLQSEIYNLLKRKEDED